MLVPGLTSQQAKKIQNIYVECKYSYHIDEKIMYPNMESRDPKNLYITSL